MFRNFNIWGQPILPNTSPMYSGDNRFIDNQFRNSSSSPTTGFYQPILPSMMQSSLSPKRGDGNDILLKPIEKSENTGTTVRSQNEKDHEYYIIENDDAYELKKDEKGIRRSQPSRIIVDNVKLDPKTNNSEPTRQSNSQPPPPKSNHVEESKQQKFTYHQMTIPTYTDSKPKIQIKQNQYQSYVAINSPKKSPNIRRAYVQSQAKQSTDSKPKGAPSNLQKPQEMVTQKTTEISKPKTLFPRVGLEPKEGTPPKAVTEIKLGKSRRHFDASQTQKNHPIIPSISNEPKNPKKNELIKIKKTPSLNDSIIPSKTSPKKIQNDLPITNVKDLPISNVKEIPNVKRNSKPDSPNKVKKVKNLNELKNTRIVIIGAGINGLSAANKLKEKKLNNITILESKDGFGGSINCIKDSGINISLSASLIHNIGEDFTNLAGTLGFFKSQTKAEYRLYDLKGQLVPSQPIQKLELTLQNIISGINSETKLSSTPLNLSVIQYLDNHPLTFDNQMEEHILYWYRVCIENFKLPTSKTKKQMSTNQFEDPKLNTENYKKLVEKMSSDLDIKLGCNVVEINWENDKEPIYIQYVTAHGLIETIEADAVIATPPYGVLKNSETTFNPKLPDIISTNGNILSYCRKSLIIFPYIFWENSIDYMGVIGGSDDDQHVICNLSSVTDGKPILAVYTFGKYTKEVDSFSDERIALDVFQLLLKIFQNVVPFPLKTFITRWTYYSGSELENIERARKPLQNRIYFSGEISNLDLMTKGGENERGISEANKLIGNLRKGTLEVTVKDNTVLPTKNVKKRKKSTYHDDFDNAMPVKVLLNLEKDEENLIMNPKNIIISL